MSDIKVIHMKHHCNEDAVDMLESALERVKAGDIVSVAISWVTKERSIGGDISSGESTFDMLASITNTLRCHEDETFG